jgi:hypothetical protein
MSSLLKEECWARSFPLTLIAYDFIPFFSNKHDETGINVCADTLLFVPVNRAQGIYSCHNIKTSPNTVLG